MLDNLKVRSAEFGKMLHIVLLNTELWVPLENV